MGEGKNHGARPFKIKPEVVDILFRADEVAEVGVHLTPQSELDKLKAPVETFFLKRDRGAGRPTKKDRREMDEAIGSISFDTGEDIPDDIAFRFGITDDDNL